MSQHQQRQHGEQKKKKKFLIIALLLMVLILVPLCTVATYTWLTISRTPKISDMEMTINSSPALQLAWSPDATEEEWSQRLEFTDAVIPDAILVPVTRSDRDDCFYAARIGTDGRMIDAGIALSDEKDANGRDGHYVHFTVYGRTGQDVRVTLAPSAPTVDGTGLTGTYLVGTPLWQAEEIRHIDGGYGAQYATRVGLRVTRLAADGSEEQPTFYVYEPNADAHVDGTSGYVATPSVDGTESLAPDGRLIRQSAFAWQEKHPVQHGVVDWSAGEFGEDVTLFELAPEEKVKIDVYIWLEGKDVDCVNALGSGALISGNIQFLADTDSGSGLVPIP